MSRRGKGPGAGGPGESPAVAIAEPRVTGRRESRSPPPPLTHTPLPPGVVRPGPGVRAPLPATPARPLTPRTGGPARTAPAQQGSGAARCREALARGRSARLGVVGRAPGLGGCPAKAFCFSRSDSQAFVAPGALISARGKAGVRHCSRGPEDELPPAHASAWTLGWWS